MNSRKRLAVNPTFVCAPSAYLSKEERVIPPLMPSGTQSEKTVQFKEWSAGNVVRYGQLNFAYQALLDCVLKYHPEVKEAIE